MADAFSVKSTSGTFADELSEGLAELSEEFGDVSCTYRRGDITVEMTGVVKGTYKYQQLGHQGIIEQEFQDYVCFTEGLMEEIGEPQPGDQIEELVGDVTETYELVSAAGISCWKYSDITNRTKIRLHTLLVDRS